MVFFPKQIVKIMLNGEKSHCHLRNISANMRCSIFYIAVAVSLSKCSARNGASGSAYVFRCFGNGIANRYYCYFFTSDWFPGNCLAEVTAWTGALFLNAIAYRKYMHNIFYKSKK